MLSTIHLTSAFDIYREEGEFCRNVLPRAEQIISFYLLTEDLSIDIILLMKKTIQVLD
jgi:hypothetical protein